jgi:hypothetical protein
MAPYADNPEHARPHFQALAALSRDLLSFDFYRSNVHPTHQLRPVRKSPTLGPKCDPGLRRNFPSQ